MKTGRKRMLPKGQSVAKKYRTGEVKRMVNNEGRTKQPDRVQQAQGIFLAGVARRLPDARQSLAQLQSNLTDAEALAGLYHFAHTLKGSGEMVGMHEIASSACEMVTALTLVRSYGVRVDAGLLQFITEKLEEIQEQTADRLQGGKELPGLAKNEAEQLVGRRKKRKILVVDDDHTITALIRESLNGQGLEVLTCDNLTEAEQLIQSEDPDLLILDILFPQGDGIDFCKKIRSKHNNKIIPIIFLSVKAKLQDRLSGFACGADDYIAKPFVMEELIARVNAIFSRVQEFEHLVMKDELTGIFNRRYLIQRLHEEIKLAQDKGGIFSVVMADLDKFKAINDTYGHSAGDQVLQYFVTKLKQNLRESDVICRCGGDEFIILLPETSGKIAVSIMQRVKRSIEKESFPLAGENAEIPLSFSAGVACYPADGTTAEELLLAADIVMYQAKQSGGNQVLSAAKAAGRSPD